MGVDALGGLARTGLKSVSRLRSSTFVDGSVTIDGAKVVTAAFNMPRARQEVLEASVDFFTLSGEEYEALESDNAVAETMACSPQAVSDILAVEGCARVKYHESNNAGTPLFMFAGPSRLSLSLAKTDTFEKYAFSYTLSKDDESAKPGLELGSVRISLDTPGSTRSHKTSLDLVADSGLSYLSADFKLPYR